MDRDVEPLLDILLRRARRLTRNDADAQDLLQDTLLHAYAGLRTFRADSNLKAWLFRILYNRWVSNFRSKQRRPSEVPVDGVTERDLADSAARSSTASRSSAWRRERSGTGATSGGSRSWQTRDSRGSA